MAEPLLVAVDADDVLFEHADPFCTWINASRGTNFKPHQYLENWPKMLGVDEVEAARLRNLFLRPEIFREFPPIEGMPEAMRKLKDARGFQFVCASKRRTSLGPVTRAALDQHYPGIFEHLVCLTEVNAEGVRISSRDKIEVCVGMGAMALVDDQWEAGRAMAQAGGEGVVFNRYPMSFPEGTFPMPLGMYEVHNPHELLRHFNAA